MKFKIFIESLSDKSYYHITFARNLSSIRQKGLRPNFRPNWLNRGGYHTNSQ